VTTVPKAAIEDDLREFFEESGYLVERFSHCIDRNIARFIDNVLSSSKMLRRWQAPRWTSYMALPYSLERSPFGCWILRNLQRGSSFSNHETSGQIGLI
jgi:hypothetical protein